MHNSLLVYILRTIADRGLRVLEYVVCQSLTVRLLSHPLIFLNPRWKDMKVCFHSLVAKHSPHAHLSFKDAHHHRRRYRRHHRDYRRFDCQGDKTLSVLFTRHSVFFMRLVRHRWLPIRVSLCRVVSMHHTINFPSIFASRRCLCYLPTRGVTMIYFEGAGVTRPRTRIDWTFFLFRYLVCLVCLFKCMSRQK